MKRHLLLFALLAALFTLLLAGCGGGSSSGSDFGPGVTLSVFSNTYSGTYASPTRIPATFLTSGTVKVIDYVTGETITTGTIGSNGACEVVVPAGLSVAIIATGTYGGKTYRLSKILPVSPNTDSPVYLTPASSLAAEALRQSHPGQVLDQDTVSALEDTAEAFFANHPGADFSLGGGLINEGAFGSAEALNGDEFPSLIEQAEAPIDSSLAQAKNAVSQIKEAGTPALALMGVEQPATEELYQSTADSLAAADLGAVAEKYAILHSRLSLLILPGLQGHWEYIQGEEQYGQSELGLLDLQMGQGYTAALETTDGYTRMVIRDNAALATDGRITVQYVDEVGTWLLTGTESDTQITIKQILQGNSAYSYTVQAANPFGTEPGADPSIRLLHIELKDPILDAPLTYDGTVSATGSSPATYTNVQYNGKFVSDELTMQGTIAMAFPAELPAGAGENDSLQEYPIGFSIKDASIDFDTDNLAIQVAGTLAAEADYYQVNGMPEIGPKKFAFTGGRLYIAVPNHSLEAKSNFIAECSNVVYNNELHPIFKRLYVDGSLKVVDSAEFVSIAGSFLVTGKTITDSLGHDLGVPTYLKITGDYTDTASDLNLSGVIEGSWDNPGGMVDQSNVKASLSIKGEVKSENYPVYTMDVLFAMDGDGGASCAINNLAWRGFTLTGAITATATEDGIESPSLTLTNQNNVTLNLEENAGVVTGTIKVAGETMADITQENGLLKVTFTDQTHQYLPN